MADYRAELTELSYCDVPTKDRSHSAENRSAKADVCVIAQLLFMLAWKGEKQMLAKPCDICFLDIIIFN